MPAIVRDIPALSRYELDAGDGAVAVAHYELAGDVITLTHTETPPQARGRGIASQLINGALEDIRARGLKVVPRCSFVRAYIAKYPEFQVLLATRA